MSHSYAELRKAKTKKAEGEDKPKAQYYFVIKSGGNGQIIATSEMYNSKQAALGGIAALYTIKGNVYSWDQTVDKTGEK